MEKKNSASVASATASATGSRAVTAAPTRADPETAAAIARDAPGDWPASTMTKRDEKKARSLGLISDKEEDIRLPAPGTSATQPPKTPSGGFADEDGLLFDSDEGYIEPPPKKVKTSSSKQALAMAGAPISPREISASPSLPKEKEKLSTTASSPSAPEGHPIQAAVSIIKDFASRFPLLEAENVQLQQAVQSNSTQLDQAVTMAAIARQEADALKKELNQLKKKLKEEEKEKAEAQIQAKEKEDKLRNSIEALLGAADIPANTVGKLPASSAADAFAFANAGVQLTWELLQRRQKVASL
ncbi:hypothetical protein QYE76_058218 [Lolium multiflorum]|uniref:Uncharacterized protein n=1 Tax=Lolium multiflorum TaxID=4521 RepID=A0AAD8WPH6_LOLMU|nr:hypothetical protein QYE76_058218 [Lolium multiflorum]